MSRDVGNAGYRGRDNEEEATDFALMAFISNPSSSSSSNSEFKTGLGYDSPFNEKEVLDIKEEEVTKIVFNNHLSDEENSLANDRFKKSKGYHVVPPHLTGNYMPPKSDVSFAGLDDSIYKFKISEIVASLIKDEKDAPQTSIACVEKPKEDRSSVPLGKSVKRVKPVESVKHVKPVKTAEQTKKSKKFSSSPKVDRKDWNGKMTQKLRLDRMAKKFVLSTNVGKGTGHRESRLVWNNVQRINHQNKFAPTAVFTRSGRIPVSAAKPKAAASTSAAKPGHPQQALKKKEIVDSGCSRHMTGNKAYLADHQKINDGGFVAFGSSRGKFTGKASIDESNLWHMGLGHVNFKTMNKLVTGNLVRGLPSKIFNNDHSCVACQKGKQHKATYSLLPITFWAEAVNTACYVLNRALVTKTHNNNPYELLYGRTPRLDFIRPFGCPVTILNTLDPLGKFEGKADEGFLVGYSVTRNQTDKNAGPQDTTGNACTQDNVDAGKEVSDQHYIVLPLWASISSTFKSSDDKAEDDKTKDDIGSKTVKEPVNKEDQAYKNELNRLMSQEKEASDATDALRKDAGGPTSSHLDAFIPSNTLLHVDQDDSQIPDLEDTAELLYFQHTNKGVAKKSFGAHAFVSYIHKQRSKNHKDYENCLFACLLSQMEPKKVSQAFDDESWVEAIGTKWVYRNKKDERGIVVRNKAMLVVQRHRKEEGIDYDEVFAPVARIEAIGIFLAFASFIGFIVYQMNVKSAFLYGTIEEEVYIFQPPGFIDPRFPNKVYKDKDDIMLVHVYVDDIIFGSTKKSLCDKFEALMHKRFQMSSMGKLTFFLGLQVKQSEEGIFISQDKYVVEILKKFYFSSVKTASTPIETQKPLVKDEEAADVDVHLYRSMIGSLMYLTASRPDIMFAFCACSRLQVTPKLSHLHAVKRIYRRLISWQCKKQTIIVTSTTEAEYVAAANYCRQFWNTYASKTVNSVKQIHAIVDGKVVVISESSVRSDLLFNNKDAARNHIGGVDAQTRFEIASKKSRDPPLSEGNTSRSGENKMEHPDDLTDFVPPTPKDSPLSGGHTPRSDEGRNDDKTEELNLTDEADTEVNVEDKGSGEKGVSTARPEVCTASVPVNVSVATLSTPPTTTPIFGDEDLTIAQTLIKLRSEKAKQEEATIADLTEEFDEFQARIDVDHELVVRMTHEKQENYTIKERARLLAEHFKRRNKQLAAERAEAIRNKPPTRTQVRNKMITYLKHMEKKSVEPESKGKKGKRVKRVADSALKQKSSKKQMMMQEQESTKSDEEESADYEHEKEELKMWLTVVSDKEETVDPEILSTKANRNTSYHKSLSSMLKKFDRQDLVDLHRLVRKIFKDNTPEGYNLLLWGDLKVMFEPNAKDEI
nr:ribonuclease H-like domain, reverse transcriptase, RNA-dependent DNA polymerase [Tanacetum cinerariifolium]